MENTNDPIDLAFGLESDEKKETFFNLSENMVRIIFNKCFDYVEKHGDEIKFDNAKIPTSIGIITGFRYYEHHMGDDKIQINASLKPNKDYTFKFEKSKLLGNAYVTDILGGGNGYKRQFRIVNGVIKESKMLTITGEYWKE